MRENEWLALAVKDGDLGALEQLWRNVRRFAYGFAGRCTPTPTVDFDDLLQSAFIGVYEAARRYEPAYGGFLTVAAWYIRSECRAALGIRTSKQQPTCVSINMPLGEDDGGTLEDVLEDQRIPPVDAGITLEAMRADVCSAVERLPEREKNVIQMRFLAGQSLQQTADALGMDVAHVSRSQTHALRLLYRDPVIASYAAEYE